MSFAILRHGKIKSTSRGAAISHNHRLGDVDQVNIDKDQKHLNRCFMGDGLAERIAKKLPEKVRKDAVVSVEVLLTSGPEFFDGMEKNRVKLAKNPKFLAWVEKSLEWAKKEFGGNLVDATLHMDESTPHLHLMAVPLTKDGRLCAKEIMARPELQRRQTQYAAVMAEFGLQRGEPAAETKRRHIGLKEDPGSGGKTSQLAAQLAKAQADLARQRKLSKEWSDADLAKVKALEAELASLSAELSKAKAKEVTLTKTIENQAADLTATKAKFETMAQQYQEHKAQGKNPALFVPEAIKTPVEALPDQWVGIPTASKGQVAVGTPVGVYGRTVVLHLGRGNHALHEVPEGQPMPRLQQTEQQKGGVGR